ncbi:hypothetical protein TNCV_3398941 [Trichonephila clavipes]|nr:hypothetical protein TNCV_3398941 [Trichonephila clavipes]
MGLEDDPMPTMVKSQRAVKSNVCRFFRSTGLIKSHQVGKTEDSNSKMNLGGRTGNFLRPSSVPLKSKNQDINRLQLAVKLPWAIFLKA